MYKRQVVVLSIVAWAVVPCVVKITFPVDAKVPKVIALSFTSVVTVVVPDTVKVPLSVIASPLVKARFPFTVPCTPNAVVVLSIVTCPAVPAVDKITFPVETKVPKVIA